MGKFTSGSEAAEYIYNNVIPKVRECAKGLSPTASKKERLAGQIECVIKAFGKAKEAKPETVTPAKRKASSSADQPETSTPSTPSASE